ncbi:monosaccharide ABC transporter membrane protein, CUT2 family [Kaistia soli DSM 19436]|uniref:Monosaccharide ABC transporter membrane protein, CUT2 family n=1 Tax=Kaistia soli DSM 19436 TaxID=1122133 RepID=A0A1M5GBN0_9HYPH|nr:ABC transporter permease [Kaistia soli]SHG01088.1 monosaccharide ABC transporter membrane protein, CUT2 family [Kaistia soli DSM 19436]
MSTTSSSTTGTGRMASWGVDRSVVILLVASVVVLAGAALESPGVLSVNYLLQQLQIAAIVGILATGAMLVILLGQIDLSVPLTITGTAILATSLAGSGNPTLAFIAIPAGLAGGLLIGAVNGLGVAIFRIPAMVWTLAVNAMLLGITVFYTSGAKPAGAPPSLMVFLARERTVGIPNAFLLWLVVGALVLFMLRRTVFGNYIYALGQSPRALFLAGAPVERIIVGVFALAGLLSSLGGLLLVGYANQAYQGMGDSYLMPVIAAVVLGGTSIFGGSGNYSGTFMGAIFITLLASVLSLMQVPDALRQMVFGGIILAMLLIDRARRTP